MLFDLFCWKFLHSIISIAHDGYLQLVMTSLKICFSVLSSSGLDNTVLAICGKVLMTLYLASMWLWLSHCKYWSTWVGFLYMLVISVQLCSGVTNVSKNGTDLSALVASL